MKLCVLLAAVLWTAAQAFAAPAASPPPNLVANPTFDSDAGGAMKQWRALWLHVPNSGSSAVEKTEADAGGPVLRVEHHDPSDWSVDQAEVIPAEPGTVYEIRARVRTKDLERVALCVALQNAAGEVFNWEYGPLVVEGTQGWKTVSHRFITPLGTASVRFRITGWGRGTVWVAQPYLAAVTSVQKLQGNGGLKPLQLDNGALTVRFDPADGTIQAQRKPDGRLWRQRAMSGGYMVTAARLVMQPTKHIEADVWDVVRDLRLTVSFATAPLSDSVTVTVHAVGALPGSLTFPQPFVTEPGTSLVLPLNEGVLFPVDDATMPTMGLVSYGGHGLCMPWYGVMDNRTGEGLMTRILTPDDAGIDVTRAGDSGLYAQPQWDATRGQFGYDRSMVYRFIKTGGYVAMAKRYRQEVKSLGLLATLQEKRKLNPNVDRLIGAVNVWHSDTKPAALARIMKDAGIERALWSHEAEPADVAEMNRLGYLTSRYDIYQDVYPANAPDWLPKEGWDTDRVLMANGDWMHGWATVMHKWNQPDEILQGGVICSSKQVARARAHITEDLKTHAYACRFIDTTTASPWRECYAPAHPLTRSQDRKNKMELLSLLSKDFHLVAGSETGIDTAVPYVDYFEGMLSLGPFRVPDSGRDVEQYKPATADVLKYQVGGKYRIPLWELVYHDCVVAHWYWGDSSNKIQGTWDRRDLLNILYGTVPLFMMDRHDWDTQKERFLQSYRNVCPAARAVGYSEMLSHEFLTPDHMVHRTRWSAGAERVVNFGEQPFTLPDGRTVAAGGFLIK